MTRHNVRQLLLETGTREVHVGSALQENSPRNLPGQVAAEHSRLVGEGAQISWAGRDGCSFFLWACNRRTVEESSFYHFKRHFADVPRLSSIWQFGRKKVCEKAYGETGRSFKFTMNHLGGRKTIRSGHAHTKGRFKEFRLQTLGGEFWVLAS